MMRIICYFAKETVNRYAPGMHHFAFAADDRSDVDSLFRFMEERNMAIAQRPQTFDYLPGYYAMGFFDPDGIKIECAYLPTLMANIV